MLIIALGVAIERARRSRLNDGMPTKDDVKERNGREVHVPIERTVKHKPRRATTCSRSSATSSRVPGDPNQQFSVGDIVIGLGVIDLCFEASRRPRRFGVLCPKPTRPLPREPQ